MPIAVGEHVEAMVVSVPGRRSDHRLGWVLGVVVAVIVLALSVPVVAGLLHTSSTPAPFDLGANQFTAAASALDGRLTADADPGRIDAVTEPGLGRLTSALVAMRRASESMTPERKAVAERAVVAGNAVLSADVAAIDAIRTRDFNTLAGVAQQQTKATTEFNTQVQAWNHLP